MARWFRFLDLISDQIPFWPSHPGARGILWRARSLVRNRSIYELAEIGRDVETTLDMFFDSEHDRLRDLIRRDGRIDLFEDSENYDGRIHGDAYDEYDIRSRENTSELDALAEAIETFFDPSNDEAVDVKEYEYLACFSLSKLDDFARDWLFKIDDETDDYVPRKAADHSAFNTRVAVTALLEAQDAVGRGELLRAKHELGERFERRMDEFKTRETLKAETSVRLITEQIRAEVLEREAQRRKEESVARNNSRHEENRVIKARVLEWFAQAPKSFPSAERAAKQFCSRLAEEGIDREQRTVADWIRAYAKQAGIKWRA